MKNQSAGRFPRIGSGPKLVLRWGKLGAGAGVRGLLLCRRGGTHHQDKPGLPTTFAYFYRENTKRTRNMSPCVELFSPPALWQALPVLPP